MLTNHWIEFAFENIGNKGGGGVTMYRFIHVLEVGLFLERLLNNAQLILHASFPWS